MAHDERPAARDRDATEKRILEAARVVLSEQGMAGFGVNAVARSAQCDKQLIYRYFGGMEGLADALGIDLANRWAEHFTDLGEIAAFASYADLIEALSLRLLDVLRRDPIISSTLLWELSDGSNAVRRLVDAKSRALSAWMIRIRGNLAPPPGCDAPAINALIIGALHYALLSSSTSGQAAGISLRTDADWERLANAVRTMVRAVFGKEGREPGGESGRASE